MSMSRPGDNNDNKSQANTPKSGVFTDSFNQTGNAQSAGTAQGSSSGSNRGASRGVNRILSQRTGMGRKRPAADIKAMQEALALELEAFNNNAALPEAQNFKLIMADRNRLNKKVDALICVLPVTHEGQVHAAIHTLLLEDANDTYEPTTLQVAGKQYRYTTAVGDVYTPEFWATIVDVVTEQSGLKIIPYDAGHQTIPAEADIKDKDAIHKFAFFASEALTRNALSQILKTTADVISLTDLGESVNTTAVIDFRTVDDSTAAGLPLAGDYEVKLRYSDMATGGQGTNQGGKAFDLGSQIPLGGATGFIDLSYSPPPQAGFGQQQQTQHYWARTVLTRLDTDQDVITPELQGLSLLAATLIGRNLNWARTWSPQFRSQDDVLNDIGAIGYELPGPDGQPYGRIPTNTASFDDAALAKLVMTAIHDRPIISLDIEESGELTWLNRVLLDAANGSPEAEQAIIDTFDNLTGGNFSKMWGGGRLIEDDNNRIHLGYFIADDLGTRRDIRNLRYLQVLNRYAEQDPQMIVKWQDTFDNQDLDPEVRLAEREDLIRKILGPTVRITGYARRVSFNPDFLNCALEAAAMAGLRIRPENTLIGFGQTVSRGRADMSSLAFGGQGGRGVFVHGGNNNAGRSFARPFTGRGPFLRS